MKTLLIFFILVLTKNICAQINNSDVFKNAKYYSITDTTYGTVLLYDEILNDLVAATQLTKTITHINTLTFKRLDNNNYYGKINKINGQITIIKKQTGYLNLYGKGSYYKIINGQAKVSLTYNQISDSLLTTRIDVYLITNPLGKILLFLDVFDIFKKEINKIMNFIKIVGYQIMTNKKWRHLKIKAEQ